MNLHPWQGCPDCEGEGEIWQYPHGFKVVVECRCVHQPEYDGGEFREDGTEIVTCSTCNARNREEASNG